MSIWRVSGFFCIFAEKKSLRTMKKFLLFLLSGLPLMTMAQNPVIRNLFSADPTARVFNGKV